MPFCLAAENNLSRILHLSSALLFCSRDYPMWYLASFQWLFWWWFCFAAELNSGKLMFSKYLLCFKVKTNSEKDWVFLLLFSVPSCSFGWAGWKQEWGEHCTLCVGGVCVCVCVCVCNFSVSECVCVYVYVCLCALGMCVILCVCVCVHLECVYNFTCLTLLSGPCLSQCC